MTKPSGEDSQPPAVSALRLIREHSTLTLFVAAALLGISYLLFGYFYKLNSQAAGANGLVLGIWGLLVSIVGFVITLWQIQKTANATQAVSIALSRLRNRMGTFDYASECMRANRGLQHSCQLLRLKQWNDAAASLFDAQIVLHRLSVSQHGDASARTSAGSTSNQILESLPLLESAAEKDIDFSAAELVMTLRKQINILEAEALGINQELYDNV
ncbi:hypothetical protein [Sphingomonas humi]|uniref:hypothetical protein n=1 Tax=Sphingomonas humi TaxID=335630 RepID=UPI0031D75E79